MTTTRERRRIVIIARARELDTSLIAMTTHGRSGLQRLVFGSTADAVLRPRHAPFCSYGSARHLESHSDISHAERSGEMTERERIHDVEIQHPKTVDELMATTRP